MLEWAREQGIDPALYVNDPEIVFRYSMVPADLRWRRGHGATDPEVYATRTVDSAPEMVAPIALTPSASVNMHDRYFENDAARKSPLKDLGGKTQECGWRVSALNGNTFHGLENHVFALSGADAADLVSGETSANGRLALKLRPYDLRALRQPDAKGRVTGGSATVPANVAADLARRVAEAETRLRERTAKGEAPAVVKPYLDKAKACLADKAYARLYFLLQETWYHTLTD